MASVLTQPHLKTKNTSTQRDSSLDLMRFIGLLIIMLAHSQPPAWLFQLRNFGTPLLIVASALTVSKIYKTRQLPIREFYQKRLIKLTVPSWIFLTLYFSLIYAAFFVFGNAADYPYSLRTVLKSYMYGRGGIDYLWILRVYIFIALFTPFALRLKSSNTPSTLSAYFLFLFLGYLFYELLISLSHLLLPVPLSKSIDANIFTLLAYALLFLYGLRLDEIKKNKILLIAGLSIIPFVGMVIYNFVTFDMFYQTQVDKYPPRMYYLSYAFCCLHIVYFLCDKVLVKIIPVKIITWLSANSLWVYLWHIMGIFIAELLLGSTNKELLPSLTKACFILWFGIMLTLLQNYLVNRYLKSSQYVVIRRLATVLS